MPKQRGKDQDARAKAPAGNVFPAKWTKIRDVGLHDLHALLFKFNDQEGSSPLLKGYSKEHLLVVVEYVTGLDGNEPLGTKFRNLPETICCIHALAYSILISLRLVSSSGTPLYYN